MVNVIIKSEERRSREETVRRSFGVGEHDHAGREACEVIAARTTEALEKAHTEGGRKSWS